MRLYESETENNSFGYKNACKKYLHDVTVCWRLSICSIRSLTNIILLKEDGSSPRCLAIFASVNSLLASALQIYMLFFTQSAPVFAI
jgi:hypothetical protein